MKLLRRISVIMSCLLFSMCSLLIGLRYSGLLKKANAITYNDTTSYVKVDEIWNDTEFSEANINKLLQLISGNSTCSTSNMSAINTMASSTTSDGINGTSASTIRSKTYLKGSSQDVVVRFGGLDWQVVFLSKDTTDDIILTLWLSNSSQDAFNGRSLYDGYYHGYSGGNLISKYSANVGNYYCTINYPTNMYSTSYIHNVTLNNGGKYVSAFSGSAAAATASLSQATQKTTSAFAKFTMDEVAGSVTKYLTTPSQVKWQREQRASSKLGNPYSTGRENPLAHNVDLVNEDAAKTSIEYKWVKVEDDNGSGADFLTGDSAAYYHLWADDYLWLPSLTEMGFNGVRSDDGEDLDGIWQTSSNQRKNFDGSTYYANQVMVPNGVGGITGTIYYSTWTRTADSFDGSWGWGVSAADNIDIQGVTRFLTVRPALHLNLTEVISTFVKEYTFSLDYNGGKTSNGSGSTSIGNVMERGTFNFTIPEKTGYTLSGWECTQSGYTNLYYAANSDGSCTINPVPYLGESSTITFKAKWTAKKYTLALNANGGYFGASTVNGISNVVLDSNITQTNTGGTIKGALWTGSTFYEVGFTATAGARIDITVSFKLNQSTLQESFPVEFGVTQLDNNTNQNPNWKTNSLQGSSTVTFTNISAGLHSFYFYVFSPASGKIQANNVSYDIEFVLSSNANGNVTIKNKTVTYGSTYGTLEEPTRAGAYTFNGWWTAASGGTRIYSTNTYNTAGRSVLYAHWTPKSFSVIFNSNGGTGSMASQNITFGSDPVALSSNTFAKDGYLFSHWETASGRIYRQNGNVSNLTANMTLYAQWEKTWLVPVLNRTTNFQGNGDSASPYLITSSEDLAYLAKQVNSGNTYSGKIFKQTNTIDLSNNYWQPIGLNRSTHAFKGTYDGQRYLIKNLKTVDAVDVFGDQLYSNVGLFGVVDSAKLININVTSGTVYGNVNTGSIVGLARTGLIENCISGASVNGINYCGMIGRAGNVKITACYNYGKISGTNNVGGIVGYYSSTITPQSGNNVVVANSYAKCDIYGYENVGGIVGGIDGIKVSVSACGFIGYISAYDYFGLIVGQAKEDTIGSIENCFAKSTTWCAISIEPMTINNCVYEIEKIQKHYIGDDFSEWVITTKGQPLPTGLSWLARGACGITTTDLEKSGYTKRV